MVYGLNAAVLGNSSAYGAIVQRQESVTSQVS